MPYVNKELQKEHQKRQCLRVKEWRERTKRRTIHAMGGGCQICGYNRCHKALELHHVDSSTKDRSFGDLMRSPSKIANWFDEFRKCVLLCANCHREVHDGITPMPEEYQIFDQVLFESWKDETS